MLSNSMIVYAAIWFVLGIVIAIFSLLTKWFLILQVGALFLSRFLGCSILFLILGMNYFCFRDHLLKEKMIPLTWIEIPHVIEGVVISIPKVTPHAESFIFKSLDSKHQDHLSRLFQISCYDCQQKIYYGDHWRFTVSLKPLNRLANPGSFNMGQWLWLNGIQGTGYIKSHPKPELLARGNGNLLTQWRYRLQSEIHESIHAPEISALIAALTMGSHDLIQESQWPILQRTGTNHLIAIAGLHIGFAASFGFLVMGFLGRRSQRLMLWRPLQDLQTITAMAFALIYGAISGFSLPTQRAVIMLIFLLLSALAREPIHLWVRLVFTLCVIIIVDPFLLYSSSLWMSFGSVALISYFCGGRYQSGSHWLQWWRLQIALGIGLAPLTLFYYHQISFVSIAANAVAVPWVGFLIVPLCWLGVIISLFSMTLSKYLFIAAGYAIMPVWHYLLCLSHQAFAVWSRIIISPWILILALIGVGLLLLPRGLPGRWFGIFFILPLVCYRPPAPNIGAVWMTTLAVGQGLSVLLRTQHHVLLYDAGPYSYSGFDAGAAIVVPYLEYLGIRDVNLMMISHGDNDHIGGAYSVLKQIAVNQIITSVPKKFQVPAQYCYRGQRWEWDGVKFEVLWPLPGHPYTDNESSCVLRVTDGVVHILLTGDIEAATEAWLVQNDSTDLAAQVLVAPHHGSQTSSSSPFVTAVHPELVIFPTGAYNRFHFPSPLIVARYQGIHAKLYNTATDGEVLVKIIPKRIQAISTGRSEQKLL